jgi:O-antigen/teichoic acid export membrane protein
VDKQRIKPDDRVFAKTILVTGGLGFVGLNLLGRLLREGYNMHREAGNNMHADRSRKSLGALYTDMLNYIPSAIIPALAGILLIPFLTRILTPHEYGVYILVITTVSLIASILGGWITISTIRFYPHGDAESSRAFISEVDRILAVTFVPIAIMLVAASQLKFRLILPSYEAVTFIGVILSGKLLVDLNEVYLRAARRVSYYSLVRSMWSIGRLILCVSFALLMGNHLIGALVGISISNLGVAVYAWLITHKPSGGVRRTKIGNSPMYTIARNFMAYGLPFSASAILMMVLSDADRFIIQWLAGSKMVGIYSAIYGSVNGLLGMLYAVPFMAAYPLAIKAWNGGEGIEKVREIIMPSITIFLIIMMPAVAGLALIGRLFLGIFTTHLYAGYSSIILPIGIGVFCFGISSYTGLGLSLAKKTTVLFAFMAIAAAVNVVLNIILIPVSGIMGAGIATLFAYGLYAAMGGIWSRGLFSMAALISSAAKIMGATGIMGVTLYGLERAASFEGIEGLMGLTAIGVASFAGAMVVMRGFAGINISGRQYNG